MTGKTKTSAVPAVIKIRRLNKQETASTSTFWSA